jgi:hypothetical protein
LQEIFFVLETVIVSDPKILGLAQILVLKISSATFRKVHVSIGPILNVVFEGLNRHMIDCEVADARVYFCTRLECYIKPKVLGSEREVLCAWAHKRDL